MNTCNNIFCVEHDEESPGCCRRIFEINNVLACSVLSFYKDKKSARTVRLKRPLNKLHGKMPASCSVCILSHVCRIDAHGDKDCKEAWTKLKRHFAM